MQHVESALREHIVCLRCAAALDITGAELRCSRCNQPYARLGTIPMLLPRVDDHLNL